MKIRFLTFALGFCVILSGCAVNHMSIQRLPGAQSSALSEIALPKFGGNKPETKISEINALVITPGGLNPPANILRVVILVDLNKSGLKGVLGVAKVDETHRAESECLRIIENFRKAGLPSEFSELTVSADLPDNYTGRFNQATFCAFTISREDLVKGSPARQTFQNFHLVK